MNENAKAWIAALRSGEYKQGRKVLRNEKDEYCCLGVACELAARAGVIPKAELVVAELVVAAGSNPIQRVYRYDGQDYYLPASVASWLGVETIEASYQREGRAANLPIHNDNKRDNFETIAGVIEKEPEGLFVKNK